MEFSNVFDQIIEKARDERPGDYKGEDGLTYCGICHRPKQTKGVGMLSDRLLPIACDCRQKEAAADAEKERQRRVTELRKYCLPREQMQSCRFSSAEDAKHIQIAQKYVDGWEKCFHDGAGLVFWGNTGTGKSFTALCIANALIEREIPVRYFSSADVVSDLTDKNIRDSIFKTIADVPLLILDDVGAERQTEFSREQICRVVDARIESGKPLICTTNYSLKDLQNAGELSLARIFDRIQQACIPVKVVGESRRKTVASKRLAAFKELLES